MHGQLVLLPMYLLWSSWFLSNVSCDDVVLCRPWSSYGAPDVNTRPKSEYSTNTRHTGRIADYEYLHSTRDNILWMQQFNMNIFLSPLNMLDAIIMHPSVIITV